MSDPYDPQRLSDRAAIVAELRALSKRMTDVGILMEYVGGFGPMATHGKQMYSAGRIAQHWADTIETEDAHPPSRGCGCAYCSPSYKE